jgi:DNA-directed RNA polymerase specialized sigma24 family protein
VSSEIDRPLVLALKRGEAVAFDAVYEAHRPTLYSYLVRLTGRKDVAEDHFQETWIRLATHAARLDAGTHLAAWLFTVCPLRIATVLGIAHAAVRQRLARARAKLSEELEALETGAVDMNEAFQ